MAKRDRPRRVTMSDVARQSGVSQSTVSFALNGNTDVHIAEKTRQRILETADRLGYRHRWSRALRPRSEEAPFIGFMIDEIATSIFAAMSIEAAQEAAWKAGFVLDVAMTGSDRAYEKMVLDRWIRDGVTGIIYGSILTRSITVPGELKPESTILLNCHSEALDYCSLLPSEVIGGLTATETLIAAGCRTIAFIGGEEWMEAANDRFEGFRAALATAERRLDENLVAHGNFMPSGGYKAAKQLLAAKPRPDGIFCANDLMAVGAYEALKEAGLRIPQDVAIVGYDDQEIARHLNPPLTTILLPHREMGEWAVDWILTRNGQRSRSPRVIKLECPLIRRESC